jgi:hypothetical protein
MQITRSHARAWAERYFLAWTNHDRAIVESLFSEDAVYYYGPFRPPARGRSEIVARWLAGAQQNVASQFEVTAACEDIAVIRWRVSFDHAGRTEMDGVLIVRFDESGACCEHREWYEQRTCDPGA